MKSKVLKQRKSRGAAISAGLKEYNKNPESRKKNSKAQKKFQASCSEEYKKERARKSVATWNRKSDEEKAIIIAKRSATVKNKSEEEQRATREKKQAVFAVKTKKEMNQFKANVSKGRKEAYAKRSPEKKQKDDAALSAGWAKRSPEKKQETSEKHCTLWKDPEYRSKMCRAISEGIQNMSEDAKILHILKCSIAIREAYASLTEEEKTQRGQIHADWWASLSKDEQEAVGHNISEAKKKWWNDLSDEQKDEFIEIHMEVLRNRSDEEKQIHYAKISKSLQEVYFNMLPERKAEIIAAQKQGWANKSLEEMEKLSKLHIAIWEALPNEVKLNWAKKKYKTGLFFSKKNNCEIRYESSYELTAFQLLESLSKVVGYNRCNFFVRYKDPEGHKRLYNPDIIVWYDDSTTEIIEVKSDAFVSHPVVVAKIKAAEEFCEVKKWKFSVWTEKQLGLKVA